jgi:hypothetical protein
MAGAYDAAMTVGALGIVLVGVCILLRRSMRRRHTQLPVEVGRRPAGNTVVRGPEDAPDFEERLERGLRRQAEGGQDPE